MNRLGTSFPRPVVVVLADGHPLFLDALSRAVRGDRRLSLAAACADAGEALQVIVRQPPDVVVADAGEAGALTCAAARLLVLAAEPDAARAHAAIEDGAAGYLSKDGEPERILDAIVAVARGAVVLDGPAQTGVAAEVRLRRRDGRAHLTRREHEVLTGMAAGRTVPRIAADLQISVATVKTHTLHAYSKLGVSDRAAAVATAMRQGLLE